jgi:protein involved in polysaccharide export with SLBB domain
MMKYLCQKISRAIVALALMAGWAALSGCQSQNAAPHAKTPPVHNAAAAAKSTPSTPTPAAPAAPAAPAKDSNPSLLLREGDTIHISFPGAPSLDNTQTIRRDGKITLDMVGEMKAAGMTPQDLELQLLKAYDSQLVVKQVSVVVQNSVFIVYVTGAVMKPGKIVSDRVETPLEAVIEAGIDSAKSNLKKVVVIRENDNGTSERFKLNLDDVMKGKPTQPFILKSMDKIYVPEKFAWY